jgi:hypothetical protein
MTTYACQLVDIFSIFKDLIVTFGIIIGGLWGYFKFKKLNVYKESILKIEELEKKLKEQPIINTSIEASFQIINNNNFIIGEITMINTGNRNTFLEFQNSICNATIIKYNEKNEILFDKEFNGYINLDTYILNAGNHINIPFIIKVEKGEIYLIEFWIIVPQKDQQLYDNIYNDLGVMRKADKIYWGTQKHILNK